MENGIEARNLKELLEDAGFKTRSYSGRGMYGKKCLAVTAESKWDIVADLVDCIENDDERDAVSNAIRNISQDSMGLGIVLYWPSVEWQKEWEDYEEEDQDYED